jgi:hypothetical protein
VLQAPVAQDEQGLPPTGATKPSSPFEKEANSDRTRLAPGCPLGQGAASSARLIERSNSNFWLQVGQKYS